MPKVTKPAPAGAVQQFDWSQTTASGFEHVQREDLGIPFLMILQKGNPQIDRDHKDYEAKHIEGAEVGDIINTLSNTVVWDSNSAPLKFIPCTYEKLFVEWTPRDKGGGMIKVHKSADILNECQRNDKGQDVLRNGNLVVTTAYFYGILVMDDGERLPAVIGLSSTQLKKSRQWLNMMMLIKFDGPKGKYTPPMYSHIYHLSTQAEHNEKGNWRGWKIELGSQVNDPMMIAEAIDVAKRASSVQRTALPPPPAESEEAPFAK